MNFAEKMSGDSESKREIPEGYYNALTDAKDEFNFDEPMGPEDMADEGEGLPQTTWQDLSKEAMAKQDEEPIESDADELIKY